MSALPRRRIGDLDVSALGLGAMTLTQVPGSDRERGVRTVHAALDAGVTLIDTADVYGPSGGYGVNERAVAEALAAYPGDTGHVLLATKGGHTRIGSGWWIDGSPAHLHRACRASLHRLGLDALPLYQLHRPDPQVPYAESTGALRELVDAGLVRRVGVSNANPEQIRQAKDVLGDALVSVQNEFSPRFRSSRPEIELCAELGLAFLAFSPLGGMREAKGLGSDFAAFGEVARERGVSPQRVCLAWELGVSPAVIPIPGASRPGSVLDSAAAAELELTPQELRRLDATAPAPARP